MKAKRTILFGAALMTGLLAGSVTANAQSADALVDKLVEKGILSVKEANQLREEADKDFTRAYSVKSGLPDWVTSFRINGDFRGRYEGFYANDRAFADRNRLRYRLRPGFTATLNDNMEVGFRLTSSEAATGGSGGDPVSGNTTFADNGSKKLVYIDLAYAKWSPNLGPEWSATTTFGKMENPFIFPSTLAFDKDYTPEGAAQEVFFRPNDRHTVKFTGGFFVLDELGASSQDPYLVAGQVHWDAVWTPKIATSLGVGMFGILGAGSLTTANVPNQNRGNTRTAGGALVYDYNPIYADAGFTYTFDHAPMYNAAFPVNISADYLYNPGASGQDNIGYSIGMTLGKAGKRGLWQFDYRYTYLGADAWYEETTESDFGALYLTAPAGGATGYGAGTNVKGHWFKLSYSPYDSLTFSMAYFLTDLIKESPKNGNSSMGRMQVDAVWKF